MRILPLRTKPFALINLFLTGICMLAGVLPISAQPDVVLDAMSAELARSFSKLQTASPNTYYLSYGVTEVQSHTIRASLGKLEANQSDSRRILDVDLRVGSYQFDNTHSIRGVAFEMGRGTRGVQLPFGTDQYAIQHVLWRATDRAYRSAAERYQKVLTNLQVKVRDEDTSADMSVEKPFTLKQEPPPFPFDQTQWEENVRAISAVFAESPLMFSGSASIVAKYIVKRFVTSEGTVVRTYEPIVQLMIQCGTKAADGMSIPLYRSFAAFTEDGLPTMNVLLHEARTIRDLALQLRTAPLAETYSGPAILSGRAAGVFFHEIFGHRVEGHRQKDVNSSQTFKTFLNKPILPDFISVIFDPHKRSLNGTDLVGAYDVDDEGVPAQTVTAVDKGVFKSFLMSRSPIENFDHSNGHGRRQAGAKAVSRQSNLIVSASRTIPVTQLRDSLRAICRQEGKEYGLYFEDIEGGFTFTGRTVPNAFNVLPLVVYKVFADGRPDELVRGVDLIGTPLVTFNNIVAAGNDTGIFNGVCGAESGGVPVSASSPSLLVRSIEAQKKQKSQAKLPILSNPETRTTTSPEARP
ncbi:MAG: acyl-phosphate glycerol 3-phosphate acyltransferase [Deltaproteobacteria bacterium]|nr:acyl-phosphate glycerol 3-phosphate acyltransferase [Candidatus Kapabacteria bacterium]